MSDQDRIDAQNEFLEQIMIEHPRQVLPWSQVVLDSARQLDYQLGIGTSVVLQGYAHYMLSNHEKALPLMIEGLAIIEKLNVPALECKITGAIAILHISLGNLSKSLELGERTLKLMRLTGDKTQEGWVLHGFGLGYEEMGQLDQALQYYENSLKAFKDVSLEVGIARALTGIGTIYQKKGHHKKAASYHEESLVRFKAENNLIGEARALNDLGTVALSEEDYEKALKLHNESLTIRRKIGNRQSQSTSLHNLGKVYLACDQPEQAITYLAEALNIAIDVRAKTKIYQIHHTLSDAYEMAGEIEKAFHHYRQFNTIKDEVFTEELNARLTTLQSAHDIEKAEKEAEIAHLKNVELAEKNNQLQKLLKELKSAQAQIIQSEKIASLGNLTAGIAHELKNPLNFVNNFSVLSLDLMEEMDELLNTEQQLKPALASSEFSEIIDNLRFNTKKVNEHGQRADKIVRSMLEHARGRTGDKQLVDINELLDEYIKLAYHGIRARDREFKADIKREFSSEPLTIYAIPQDLGRVFLNLINNAFYTIGSKSKQDIPGYSPQVTIKTQKKGKIICILIEDNGKGIGEEDLVKIFEPFFTTKPPGSGTGLGLSLSHDIIVQGHAGELLVESEVGKGSQFTINLPVSQNL